MKKDSTKTKNLFASVKRLHNRLGRGAFNVTHFQTKHVQKIMLSLLLIVVCTLGANAQITLKQDYKNNTSASIGTFQGIHFREAGFSGLYAIPHTNGKEFWTVSDRGVNVDAANANLPACRPTYDKIYGFSTYAPKIHRIRLNGDSLQILQTITMKRPGGTTATGLLNPTGFGSSATEMISTDTVFNCANFNMKTAAKDVWGIDSEGIAVDKEGNFWICEEGGPTIWKLNASGVVVKRFTPYANLFGAQPEDVQIDSVFKYRKNNRGFEGITITPNGKIYAIIQSPILYPTKSVGEGTRIHRILEIDPTNNSTRMLVYLNDGIIGGSGSSQIRLRDWKIGDMAAVNDHTFLVMEAALRGTSDIKRVYLIDINGATPVTSGLYNGVTLEALVDANGLTANGIVPVQKTLFMNLLANGWSPVLEKAEGIAILNDSTVAISNDNDFGQYSPLENGIATATENKSHVYVYGLQGTNKLVDYQSIEPTLNQGLTGPSTSQTPYLNASVPEAKFTSILSVNDVVGGYKMVGIPDGLGAFDNNDGSFTVLMNHELNSTVGVVRAHGTIGSFVSKWIINKSDLSVVSGSDLIQTTYMWDAVTNSYVQNPVLISRLCSGDLPVVSAFYNAKTGLGTQERIFMSGEEAGPEGRAFGHIATGMHAGKTYQLPSLGRFSYENAVASPYSSNKTVVVSTDDATPGQVYVYIGTKTNAGLEVDKAGLTNGKLFGVAVSGLPAEISAIIPTVGTTFSLADLGHVQNMTGADLNTASIAAGVTNFLRPEDGHWDPSHLNDFYFVTTNNFTSPSRLWRLRFTDIANPELGGTIEAVLDGTEGQKMLDNMTVDSHGRILMQEDVGNQTHLSKIWQYTIATDSLKQVAEHDPSRFITGVPNFLTQDEESSGIIDVQEILGPGMFLLDVQAHYAIPGEVVEGGQLLAFFNPDSYCLLTAGAIEGATNACAASGPIGGLATYSITTTDASSFKWTVPAKAILVSGQGTNTIIVKYLTAFVSGNISVTVTNACGGSPITKTLAITESLPAMPEAIVGSSSVCAQVGTNTQVMYSIDSVEAAVSYYWSLPPNVTIISGQGTTSVNLIFHKGFVTSNIRVRAVSGCGKSSYQTLRITSAAPSKPVAITGTTTGICSPTNTFTYTVEPVNAATSYTWSTSIVGATIVSNNTEAIITFPSFLSGVVSVTANNDCGSSQSKNLTVYATPKAPESITGLVDVCGGSVQTYSIDSMEGITFYAWSVPNGSIIQSGSGTSSITVLMGYSGGSVKVKPYNNCGNAVRRLTVNIAPCENAARLASDVSVYPVPSAGVVNVRFTTPQSGTYQYYITDLLSGELVFKSQGTSVAGENEVNPDLTFLENGWYAIHITSASINYYQKIQITH